MATDAPNQTAPYASFKSVLNFLDKVKENHKAPDVPQQIDRSYWGQWFSGGYGPQIVHALRFLGLLDADGRPTSVFARAVHEPEYRRDYMREALEATYAPVLALNLQTATMGQLEKVFRENYGVGGDTLRKAIVFFLHGAEFAGIEVGDHLRPNRAKGGNGTTTKRRAATTTRRTAKPGASRSRTPAAQESDFVDLKRKYLEALIAKVEAGDADIDLLNRVQTLLFEEEEES